MSPSVKCSSTVPCPSRSNGICTVEVLVLDPSGRCEILNEIVLHRHEIRIKEVWAKEKATGKPVDDIFKFGGE
jgi:hypothetical protein